MGWGRAGSSSGSSRAQPCLSCRGWGIQEECRAAGGHRPCPTTLRAHLSAALHLPPHPRATWGPLSTHPAVPHHISFASRARLDCKLIEEGEQDWVASFLVASRLLALAHARCAPHRE